MRKVVYNNCFGGFSLSRAAVLRARELGAKWALSDAEGGECTLFGEYYDDTNTRNNSTHMDYGCTSLAKRHDSILVQIVEELGKEANGPYARLKIAKVSGKYRIDEYGGNESVMTPEDYVWVDED